MAKTIIIFPGGFHPWTPGHMSVYEHLTEKFPSAVVYVASSDSTEKRPFPFKDKKELAVAAGVPSNRFLLVKNPYKAEEITAKYNPEEDSLIFALSQKDADRISFKPKKDGSLPYFQKWESSEKLVPFKEHGYIYIAPIKPYKILGKVITSASDIRSMYSEANDKKKLEIIKELYPNGDPLKIKAIFDGALTESDWSWFFEDHIFHYKEWGWIDPKGKLILPKPTDKTHTSILVRVIGEKISEAKATDMGWIRWFIDPDSNELYFNTRKPVESSWSSVVKIVTKLVEEYPTLPGYCFEWFPSVTKVKRIEEDDPSIFLKKVKNIFRRASIVSEDHIFQYKEWGWIDPKGKLYLPKEADKSHDSMISRIFGKSGGRGLKFSLDPLESGWIRWFIDPDSNALYFNTEKPVKSSWPAVMKTISGIVNKHLNLSSYNFYDWRVSMGAKKHNFKPIEEDDPSVFLKKVNNIFRRDLAVSEHIVKTKKGYILYSKSKPTRRLGGPYPTRAGAEKRERQVQYFKHAKEEKKPIETLKPFNEFFEGLEKACWKGYEAIGMKEKDGKKVPNCVPVKEDEAHPTHLDPKGGQQVLLEHPIPDKVKEAAKTGIDLRKEYNRGGTPAAIQMAKDLVTKNDLSVPKLKAMKAYFFRNKTKVQAGEAGHRPSSNTIPSDEYIGWMLYGGNPGRDWAERILNPKKEAEIEKNTDTEE